MFSRKKQELAKRRHHDLSQFGLTDIPDDFDPTAGCIDDAPDSDLESELAAITGGNISPKSKVKQQILPHTQLDQMIEDSLRDISDDDDDNDLENDTDLLGELKIISGSTSNLEHTVNDTDIGIPKVEPEIKSQSSTSDNLVDVITHRIEIYKYAEANAKAANENTKARRFGRGLKTLHDLFKKLRAGQNVDLNDIPPELGVKTATSSVVVNDDISVVSKQSSKSLKDLPTTSNSPTKESCTTINTTETMTNLCSRQKEYKIAALQSKKDGDTATAIQLMKVFKQFDVVIKMVEEGQVVDLSDMPPPPSEFAEFMKKMGQIAEDSTPVEHSVKNSEPTISENTPESGEPITLLNALQQRLEKYKSVEASAKMENNASKARRFGRIVKQYEDAIKLHKANKVVPFEDLPIPPGFGPLPTTEKIDASDKSKPKASSTPSEPIMAVNSTTSERKDSPLPQQKQLTTRVTGNQHKNNIAEQQMKFLLKRQNEFKLAAISAKKLGEMEQAKAYLKIYKGFDALLNAASSGLPVDLSTLPVPPSDSANLEATFAMVSAGDCDPNDDISDIGLRIEEQLVKQLMMCKNTRDHHKAMGDIAGMNRFENLALTVQKDLDLVRYFKQKGFSLPKFHYEKRSFNIVHSNTDLTDNELEIIIVRGINFNVTNPKEVDTYVKIEFPLLNDETFKTKTSVIKNTDSPDYNERIKIDIQRGNRQFQRIFKRHAVKFEVYSRGGFLRSDTLIGNINVKLNLLETKCDIHDTYDLMDGRKRIGGKLEVKIRIRNPILTKQMEHVNEKWLVLNHED